MDDQTLLATTASLDRTLAAIAWAERQFKTNAHCINNARVEAVVLHTLQVTAGPDHDGEPGRSREDSHLLLPSTGQAVPVAPDADLVGLLRTAAPTRAACDYCQTADVPVAGLLPVATPPQIVALVLCGDCLVVLGTAYPLAHFVFHFGGTP
ncbi:MAG: hypothetical protein QOH75_498 [Actinomycetota bacterium]|jgi:hypothetical protein|nr:hypothetical protein [Actinomycetota bacterium]